MDENPYRAPPPVPASARRRPFARWRPWLLLIPVAVLVVGGRVGVGSDFVQLTTLTKLLMSLALVGATAATFYSVRSFWHLAVFWMYWLLFGQFAVMWFWN